MAMSDLFLFDMQMRQQYGEICVGTDEVGRGPLAGPVVAAAVVFSEEQILPGLNDSKKLSEKQREYLYPKILHTAQSVGLAVVSPAEIDQINILNASLMAMSRAITSMEIPWDFVLVDGNRLISGISVQKQHTVVKGDSKSASIAAASIVAKVFRDRLMKKYHARWPQYGFDRHKGYPTKEHRTQIMKHGLIEIHRRTFCHKFLKQPSLFD